MKKFTGNLTISALRPDEPAQQKTWRQLWRVNETLVFHSERFGDIVVPAGMVSDLASVPRRTKAMIDDNDPDMLWASMPHDAGYEARGKMPDGRVLTRKDIDDALIEAMEHYHASMPPLPTDTIWQRIVAKKEMLRRAARRMIVYKSVRWFGQSVWDRD